ncbi:hypothetical protein [Adlercreutzia mucosicola]|uniref:hypothetical protein n=1 Tax=Adlercreutzia mucosicola TaxID=580026 RepID=UPI00041EFA1A|nr:hypothetical protein [Adlercreutzia mucosicola]MCR2034387.1 hypothetical protein [Adlercreutzia mucosicola]
MPSKDNYYDWRTLGGSVALISYPDQKRYIERVLYNAPATIIFWSDGEKTVVKCHECVMSGQCKRFRTKDGACGCQAFHDGNPALWRREGVVNASLKRTFPNYIDQLSKALGE